LLERQRSLLTDHIDLLRDSVRRVKRLYPFHIDAWVVLPDHMHCVWTLLPDSDDFPVRWRLIKLLFSSFSSSGLGMPFRKLLLPVFSKLELRGLEFPSRSLGTSET